MFENKRVFIVVKTYPTISEKYAELVCTAGILEDGSWIRLYPIPFRKLDIDKKYNKYTWIQVKVKRNTSDFRPETYRPYDLNSIAVETKSIKVNWDERRNIIFKNKKVYTNMRELIDKAKSDGVSLAVFKPAKIIDFVIEPAERDWNPKKLESLRILSQQMSLFETPEEIEKEFKVVPKVPYKFSYKFADDSDKQSTMMIEDWEIGMLYFNCLKRARGNESIAIAKVRLKYFDEFLKKDLHFFLGTTKQFHNVAPNPFIIIGAFYPPMLLPNAQINLFDL
ncbi:MAG: hypothetical protein LBT79_06365 [Elusimicrobiota bacterium]|jgi:hypothetical protein|nr:hypothetical protein [Elusimicrobiota bacterium]